MKVQKGKIPQEYFQRIIDIECKIKCCFKDDFYVAKRIYHRARCLKESIDDEFKTLSRVSVSTFTGYHVEFYALGVESCFICLVCFRILTLFLSLPTGQRKRLQLSSDGLTN